MTAVVRPVSIENSDLCDRRLSSLSLEEILNELDVFKAHCKTHAAPQSLESLVIHRCETVDRRNGRGNVVFINESGRLFGRCFPCFSGVDKVALDLSLVLFGNVTIESNDPCALYKRSLLLRKELDALCGRVSPLVVLARK